ncbi:MAG: glycosyltransferase, partial [Muribaculaceae bacterium]|nr:glycosyltransferase [Muribaculaceae bacterium]
MPYPKISIIVPVYNTEKYLNRCVDSILAQTFTDFELLLIDDGSRDRSGVICDEYVANDPRVRVFHKPNGGVSSARNVGLDNARGEWVMFVDADDEIRNLDNLIVDDPDLDIVLFTLIKTYCDGRISGDNLIPFSGVENTRENYLTSYLHFHVFNSVCSKLIRRNIINNIRLEPEIKFGEDALFFLKVLKLANRIGVCEKVKYIYDLSGDYGVRYQESVAESVRTMQQIFDAYRVLNCRNKIFERNVFDCYRSVCSND